MMLARLRQQARTLWTLYRARTPVYLILYLTSRCNFRCPMCFYLDEIKDPDKEEIAFPELEKMSRSMGPLVQLSLTGGEPFLRHDIPDVVDIFARNNHVQYITIPTNGSLTDRTTETVTRLVRGHPEIQFRIPISLDGYPDDHDAIRGAKSFDRIVATVDALCDVRGRVNNLTVDINTCYSSLNQGRVKGLGDFVADRFAIDNHSVTYVRGNADEETKNASASGYVQLVQEIRRRHVPSDRRPFASLLRAILDDQWDIIKRMLRDDRMYVPCVAGKKMIVVNEKAQVLPCEILNKKLGNLKDFDYDVRKLLNQPQALELVDWIRETKCHCTFECALATSIIFDKASYPRIAWRALRSRFRRRPRAVAVEPSAKAAPAEP